MDQAARLYRIPVVDYGRGKGVILGSGCGIMMAAMDSCGARWCVDLDILGHDVDEATEYRVSQFALMAHAAEGVALCGWFSITHPGAWIRAMQQLDPPAPIYAGHILLGLPGDCATLQDFIGRCNALWGAR